jgi:hypothetical protein
MRNRKRIFEEIFNTRSLRLIVKFEEIYKHINIMINESKDNVNKI